MIDELDFSDTLATTKAVGMSEEWPIDEAAMVARWERLRIIYNAILTVEVLVISLPMFRMTWAHRGFLVELILGAVGANLCYCAGPVINFYFHCANIRGRAVTTVLFVMGTAVAMLLTLLYVLLFTWLPLLAFD